MYLPLWMSILRSSGAYAADEAAATARTLLPDTCAATASRLAACPNAHALTNDVFRSPAGRAVSVPAGLLDRSLLNGLCPRA